MNRKKGIIIGTTGIIIVTLALIGFTYGFYLSLISGNETSKKVKVTAGKSKLEYVELSTEVDIIIGPGYTNTKYFAVQNVGDISASYYLYLVDVENTFNRKNDIVYTIYRKAYDYSEENVEPEEFDINGTYDFSSWENVTNSHCKTVSEFTDYGDCQYPSEKSQLSTQKQTIMEKDDYYVYAFVVTYINQPEIDQIDDEESVFSGKVKVYADETGTDVSPFEDGTLADAIVENAIANKNGTLYSETPLTTPGVEVSGENEATLSLTTDDYGPSYYFRGNVENNYLNFSGMCWRILRIQGDGTVKLVLADENNECNSENYDVNNNSSAFVSSRYDIPYKTTPEYKDSDYLYENSDIPDILDTWSTRENKILDKSKLYLAEFCNDTSKYKYDENSWGYDANNNVVYDKNLATKEWYSLYDYSAKDRLTVGVSTNPTLKCDMVGLEESSATKVETYIGLLTADEVAFAGAVIGNVQPNYYLNTNAKDVFWYWTMTPSSHVGKEGSMFIVRLSDYSTYIGSLGDIEVSFNGGSIRPVVVLTKGTTFVEGGEGTQSNPYVVE